MDITANHLPLVVEVAANGRLCLLDRCLLDPCEASSTTRTDDEAATTGHLCLRAQRARRDITTIHRQPSLDPASTNS